MERYSATCYLSAPKGEDVILSATSPHLSVMVCADGASTLGESRGQISGGGREAAMIAAHTAITYLTSTLSVPLGLDGMLSALECAFCEARSALERHNSTAGMPGATTLLTAILCQAENGRWFWLHGSLGNGVLSLLQTRALLSGWPVHTPLLSQQASGITTITLPGDRAQGYQPSVGMRPHNPGELLVIGSDGLEHLDKVTKTSCKLTFCNFLWARIQQGRSNLDMCLNRLQTALTDADWQHALLCDDTTIGLLWA